MKRILVGLMAMLMLIIIAACGAPAPEESMVPSANDAAQMTPDAGIAISDLDGLVAALQNESVTKAHISADLTIAPESDQSFEREGFVLTIDKGVTVTIGDFFTPVFFGTETVPGIVNNGTLIITSEWNFGALTLENNGTIEIQSGALLAPGMAIIQNNNTLQIDKDAEVRLERGSGIVNDGTIQNSGTLNITDDGGSLINNENSSILNTGHIAWDGDYQNRGTYRGTEPLPGA